MDCESKESSTAVAIDTIPGGHSSDGSDLSSFV